MNRASRMVWHVYRYRERVELPDDVRFNRERPLLYSRDPVSAGDDESASYLQQIDTLSRRQNGLELEGAWSRIRRAASARSKDFRGYLLTADNRPLSVAEIGRTILFCDTRRATRILKALKEIGLIEQARCPIFDLKQKDVPAKKRRETPKKKAKCGEGKSRQRTSISRRSTVNYVNARDPLRAKQKREAELTSDQKEKEIQDELTKKVKTEGESQDQPQAPATPAAAPPDGQGPGPAMPPEVTGEGPRHFSPTAERQPATALPRVFDGPKILPLHRDADASPVGHLLPRVIDGLSSQGYAVRAPDFAQEIFRLLGPPFDVDDRDGRRNLANFEKALLAAVDAGLSPPAMEDLMQKSRKDAARIGAHRARYYRGDGSPEQYWRFLFNKHLNSRRGLPAAARQKAGVV